MNNMTMDYFWRVVDRVINESDILLEVIDARMPNLTRNKRVEDRIRGKKKFLIIVENKSDLVTRKMRMDILRKSKSKRLVFVSSKDRIGISDLEEMISELDKKKQHWGFTKVGVIGYPNTGKSSIINALVGRSAVK